MSRRFVCSAMNIRRPKHLRELIAIFPRVSVTFPPESLELLTISLTCYPKFAQNRI
jgi:hypothetical protein